VQLPVTESGTYYLILRTDDGDSLTEPDEINNEQSGPFTFQMIPPDLAPISLRVPDVVSWPPDLGITIVWGVTNQGPGSAMSDPWWGTWSDGIYVSTRPVLDDTATRVTTEWEPGPVPAGSGYWRTNTVVLPALTNGTYYLFVRTDSQASLIESDEDNNTM